MNLTCIIDINREVINKLSINLKEVMQQRCVCESFDESDELHLSLNSSRAFSLCVTIADRIKHKAM